MMESILWIGVAISVIYASSVVFFLADGPVTLSAYLEHRRTSRVHALQVADLAAKEQSRVVVKTWNVRDERDADA